MATKTIKQIITDFQNFSTSYAFLNNFGWGDVTRINTKEHQYPMLWIQPDRISRIEGSKSLFLTAFICDVMKEDKKNLLDAISDIDMIADDITSQFFNNKAFYNFELNQKSIDWNYFEERYDDYLCGLYATIELRLGAPLNRCTIPFRTP